MKKLAFIGLGTMGMPMARNLLKAGYPLTVFNRTEAKAQELAQEGAQVAATPADAARGADVLFTNVSNDQALLDVLLGENGVLEGAHEGLTVLDCSTVSPETSRRAERELAARGASFLDTPVTGSKPAAIDGTLVFMVGGSEDVFRQHADLFETLGSRSIYLGPSGSGSSAKLAHNTIVGINALALAEGLSLAAKSGLDPEKFLGIVMAGAANSRQAELKGSKIITRNFETQFSLQLMLKDLLLAADQTAKFQLPLPLLHAASTLYQMGLSKGLGEQDLCSVIQCYEDWLGAQVAKPDAEQR
ncbi:2-hydroxy-3-oxopropionate reductase [Paenibacillus sp. J31TS4]|uniref:NAD(P)-dependent oxidoreductase n=1 Tax=Paenibacillus sp. J31TS4 TaxID=2807195 RepID=UPI001B13B4F3|nr:NAD(P)-dependent oxidoreductase [Paenibacillus sp. J31TS4]GIP38935.1 2-hydroxy-3-oxopropionate reductase [Paenibacillus sp. J31TS4]